MKVRKALIWITLISVLIGVANWAYTFKSVNDSKHIWCELVNTSIKQSPAAHKPSPTDTNPKDQQLWVDYQLVLTLKNSLGC
jgi:hypothetical protein